MSSPTQIPPGDSVAVELYCRPATAAVVPVDRHHGRLAALSSAGVVDDVSVSTWPGRVTLSSPTESPDDADRAEAVATREAFDQWAERAGVDLGPAFGRHGYRSEFTGERRTALSFPVVALAVRDAETGDLRGVYPHHDGEPVTVDRGIDRLAARRSPTVETTTLGRPSSVGD